MYLLCVEELLQFIIALDGIHLIFAPPPGHLAVALGQSSLELSLGLLLLQLLPQQMAVMTGRLESVGQDILSLRFFLNVPFQFLNLLSEGKLSPRYLRKYHFFLLEKTRELPCSRGFRKQGKRAPDVCYRVGLK